MILRGENWKRYLKIYFFTVMRKITVALNQAITYNDTQSKYIGRLRNWITSLSNFSIERALESALKSRSSNKVYFA